MSGNAPWNASQPDGNGKGDHAAVIILRNVGRINPSSIDEYVSLGGYAALRRAIENGQSGVLDEVEQAGLRGRGGAGFPTAKKWRAVAGSSDLERYVIANAFGADPSALGDRTLLESDPHAVLEGLAIAAFATGANRAFVYCCSDHSVAVERVGIAIRQAEERGFLGSGICGSAFDCHVEVAMAPAGFAAGEETAAIALIEGRRPMPTEKPPYPAQSGLWGKPTAVNNAETLANVPWIVRNGAEAFARLGTSGNAGTKLVTIVGCAGKPGVVEVPLGTTLRDIVAKYGGGVRGGRRLKALQFGGPTGAILPESALDTKLEFEALRGAGSLVGSGSLLVLDEAACIVGLVASELELLSSEACGRCVPGRLGSKRLQMVLGQIAKGEGRPGDLELLVELAENMADGAACGYGVGAANPVLSALKHFRDEFEAHLSGKQCPTGRCAIAAMPTAERREELWKSKWPIRR